MSCLLIVPIVPEKIYQGKKENKTTGIDGFFVNQEVHMYYKKKDIWIPSTILGYNNLDSKGQNRQSYCVELEGRLKVLEISFSKFKYKVPSTREVIMIISLST